MAHFGHFWANFMHVVHKIKFVIFAQNPENEYNILYFCTAAEGDTADRLTVVPADVVRGADSVQIEGQGVGVVAIVANRGPVVAGVACAAQVVAWDDFAAPDEHQRRLYNSIRIS